MKRMVVAAICAISIIGCVTTQAVRLGAGPVRAPVSPDKVIIYRTADQVQAKYEEVALLSSSGDHSLTNEEAMYESMRKKAADLGANGIILQAVEEPGAGAKVAQALFGTGADRKGKAIAIFVFPAPDSTNSKRPK